MVSFWMKRSFRIGGETWYNEELTHHRRWNYLQVHLHQIFLLQDAALSRHTLQRSLTGSATEVLRLRYLQTLLCHSSRGKEWESVEGEGLLTLVTEGRKKNDGRTEVYSGYIVGKLGLTEHPAPVWQVGSHGLVHFWHPRPLGMLSPAKQILYLGTRLEIVNRESKYPHGNKFLVQREWEAVLCHVISPIEDGDGQGGACGPSVRLWWNGVLFSIPRSNASMARWIFKSDKNEIWNDRTAWTGYCVRWQRRCVA